jgi:hypothetical protein
MMEFPARSRKTTDQTFSWDEVRVLLDKEFMRRGEYIARILMALRERFGDEVYGIAEKVIYEIGFEKGTKRASDVITKGQERDLASLSELIAHRLSRLYFGTTAELADDTLIIREEYCPLPHKWKEMGLADIQIAELCSIFDQVDKGMVEGYNNRFGAELSGCKTLAEEGYCQMTVIDRRLPLSNTRNE